MINIYMLRRRPKRIAGITVAMMMIMPPIVGTPCLVTPYGSILASRCSSLRFLLFIHLINHSPNQAEMMSDSTSVSKARNEM